MAIVALEKRYRSIHGAPAIDRVDTAIFRLRYFMRCMQCTFCGDQCCSYGVDVDVENVARIEAHADAIERRTGVARAAWFTGEWVDDREFPGGKQTRTRAVDGRCVFLAKGGRGCVLHAYAIEAGLEYHLLKPMVSALFPVTFDDGLLHASDEVASGELACSVSAAASAGASAGDWPTLYDGARGEIAHYFGGAMVAELDLLRERFA